MKSLLLYILLFTTSFLYSQEENLSHWVYKIDSNDFKVFSNKTKIPIAFLNEVELKRSSISNQKGNFNPSCVGGGKKVRLNWAARDSDNHWIISLSFSGKSYYTKVYLVSFDNSIVEANYIRLHHTLPEASFSESVDKIMAGNFDWK